MKSIRVAVIYLFVGLIGGLALSALWSDDAADRGATPPLPQSAIELRMAALEDRMAAVTADNAELAAALARLEQNPGDDRGDDFAPGSTMTATAGASAAQRDADSGEPIADTTVVPPRFENLRRRRDDEAALVDRLTAAGFSVADAQLIETRIEELRVEAMQSRYEALRNGESPDALRNQFSDGTAALRSELGEDQYERFLEATGRPTRVDVTSVMARSAAETAGLQDGDEIVAYDGARVFDIRDLNRVLLEGEPGEPVVVDVVRDGQPMQVVMPRGPLGISSGFARRGPR